MTIFDSGYSAFRYEPVGPVGRITALARTEFGKIFKSKKGLILFIACVVYIVVLLVLVFFNLGPQSARSEQIQGGLEMLSPRLSPLRREFYLGYSTDQGFLAFILLTSIIGVRSISGDRAVNALEIYWTRGITPWGYFLGKWMGSFFLLAAVFVAGPVVAWLYGLISAPDATFFEATVRFIPMLVLALVLKCLVLSFLAVGFSGLGSSPNVVTFLWLIAILGSATLVRILKMFSSLQNRRNPEHISDSTDWYDALCPWDAMVRIEEHIAGLVSTTDYEVWIAWTSLGVLILFLLFRLRHHLRTTEAMA